MEPISKKIQITADTLLYGSFFLFVLFPLLISLSRFLINLDSDFLSPLFFLVLLKATLFAFTQALLSLLAIAFFSYFLVAYLCKNPSSSLSRKILETSGLLSFSLSPTLIALALLFSFTKLFNSSPTGIAALVFCHFLMNAAYFSSQFLKRTERFYAAEGNTLSEYLRSLGAKSSHERKFLIWPLFKNDIRSWGPQVFLWCFMSFAPVVLLSSGNGQNTPELLLYYSLLNDPSGSRVLIIFMLTALISFGLSSFASQKSRKRSPETYSVVRNEAPFAFSSYFLIGTSVLLLFPFLFSLLSPFFIGGALSRDLIMSLVPTFYIFFLTFLIALSFGVLSLLASKELKLISFFNFISGPMILMGILTIEPSPTQSYFWISLGSFLALVPWAHRRIRSQVEALPAELRDSALSLGMKDFSYLRFYLWPELGPFVLKFSLLFSLWSLGEYTFSKALLNQNTTLALLIEEKLRRYQFAEASTGLALSLLMSVIVVTPVLWKARKNVAL